MELKEGNEIMIQPRHSGKLVPRAEGPYVFSMKGQGKSGLYYKGGELYKAQLL